MIVARIFFSLVAAAMLVVAGMILTKDLSNNVPFAFFAGGGLIFWWIVAMDAYQAGERKGLEDGRSRKAYEDTRDEESFTDAEVDAALEIVRERRKP